MTTTKPIHQLLRLSEADYAEDYFQKYMRWCESKISEKETGPNLQQLLSNTAISNWYNTEFYKLQFKFCKMVENTHQQMDVAQVRQIYCAVTSHIFTYYPRSLFDLAKHIHIINLN